MVNKEAKQKDGFGLPSTDKRKKDNALIEAARIADKIAKWNAEFVDVIKVVKEAVVKEDNEAAKLAAKLEEERLAKLDAVMKAEKEAKAKEEKKAKLQAELDALQ